jgi:uncharacterized protein YgfB (UPF0149 family)
LQDQAEGEISMSLDDLTQLAQIELDEDEQANRQSARDRQ